MAKVDFRRVATNAEVENIDIKDGQFIVTGEGKTFVDYGNERKSIAGTPDTEMSDSSTNSVENKVIKGYVDNVADSIPELSNEYSTSNENGYTQNYINTQLASSEWVSLGNTVYYKKCGNIVTVTALSLNDFTLVNDDYTTVATLPVGARPTRILGFPWGFSKMGVGRIYDNGQIQLYVTGGATGYWSFTITFII